ncbi:MAG: bifunctional hydroxymethylpyrimidine kinase/phosphomethylpyrimidine kinase [Litoreibacter sp.]|uniref:bifunctional hydroxymethylpyrimidine kinase/phosphomethylpyrimidine kinase n=1 Tax=Litoreibacter sp. TaxID=1969459 RepID=UPI0032978905
MIPNVLSIAGSDPSGGAGIQADLKAISANGAFAMAAVTALTAQNTQGVSGIHLVPPAFVQSQIDSVFDDIQVDAVKIGMIADAEIAQAVARTLARRDVPIILDPVMIAKGGAALLQPDAVAVLRDALLPTAHVLTPNLPEAAHLLEADVAATRDEMASQGQALCALGPRAVLMKGGHLSGPDSPDCLVTDDVVTWFEGPRMPTQNTHGTGCTLSSALAAQLVKTNDIQAAVAAAKSYVASAIAHADQLNVGSGHGPTHHFASLYASHKETSS